MNQTLHIFRKDVRHLWPELATYLVLLITFAWAAPQTWDGNLRFNSMLQLLTVLLDAVLFIVWLVMMARLVQDEPLVGDQQFWITRPYTRASLLSAKLLFLVACVMLPFALMQIYLLVRGGLHPMAALPDLLLNLGALLLLCWLPFAAVAAVTSSLPRMVMSLLGAVILWIIVLVVLGRGMGVSMDPPYLLRVFAVIWAVMIAGTLAYQYQTRKTKYARIALIAVPVLLLVLFAAYPTGQLISVRYSNPKTDAVHMNFNADPVRQERQDGQEAHFGGRLLVNLPIRSQTTDPKARLDETGVLLTADVPGYHYQSHWLPGGFTSTLLLPEDVVHRLEAAPAHLHMVMVGDQLAPGTPEQATVASSYNVPDRGRCTVSEDGIGGPFCHFAYKVHAFTEIKGAATPPPCGSNGPMLDDTTAFTPAIKPFVFDPVNVEEMRMRHGTLCPGTPLTFTAYHAAGHVRAELDIPSISVRAYVRHNDFRERPQVNGGQSQEDQATPAAAGTAPPAKQAAKPQAPTKTP